jgi:hypothetical protein
MVTGTGYRRKLNRSLETSGNKKAWHARWVGTFDRADPAGFNLEQPRDQQEAHQPSGNGMSGQAI